MLKVNEQNLVIIVRELLEYERIFNYNSQCYSSGDVLRGISASNDVDYFLSTINKQGVDLETRLKSLEVGDLKFHNSENFVESKSNEFNCEIKINNFEEYLKRNNKSFDWLISDKTTVISNEYYRELELGLPRWTYREWNVDKSSIEYLKSNSVVYRKSHAIVERLSKNKCFCGSDKSTFNVVSISEIHDRYSDEDRDCSSFIVVMDRDGEKNSYEKVTLVVQKGGFYEDIIILDNMNNIERIIPIDGVNPLDTRIYSKELSQEINKYIEELNNYKVKITQYIEENEYIANII